MNGAGDAASGAGTASGAFVYIDDTGILGKKVSFDQMDGIAGTVQETVSASGTKLVINVGLDGFSGFALPGGLVSIGIADRSLGAG